MSLALHARKTDSYAGKLVLSILALFALMIAIMYKIQSNDPLPAHNGFVVTTPAHKTLYLLSSKNSALLYAKNGASAEAYADKLKRFARFLEGVGYRTEIIPASKVTTLPEEATLMAVDAPALSDKTKEAIKTFVRNGGSLFFNFTTGYSDAKGTYLGDRFIREITGLTLNPKRGFLSFKGEDTSMFATLKMLSPFATYLGNGESLTVILYDKVPFYLHDKHQAPDLYATSFSQATPPVSNRWQESLKPEEAGLGWHGYYGKGRWAYLSFPSYSFYDNNEQKEAFKKLMAGIIDYLDQPVVALSYPFLDRQGGIFISEDTEYKFTNFQRFADLAQEFQIPVTAFIVASLADKPEHRAMMQRIAKNPYVEFASHSTTHQKIVGKDAAFVKKETADSKEILDKYAPKPIRGFRPPREELNDLMKRYLDEGGFLYVLGATEEFLYPKADKRYPHLLYIPRHGTDDYSYLVNLDWSQQQIVDQMIEEANFVNKLNAIYTLSVHTHLFSYGTNINILRKFFHYLKEHPELKPLSGEGLYKRVMLRNRLHESAQIRDKRLILTLSNDNDVPVTNWHIKLFKSPHLKIVKGGVDAPHVTALLNKKQDLLTLKSVPPHTTLKVYFTMDQQAQ